jgi:hypothetical protein
MADAGAGARRGRTVTGVGYRRRCCEIVTSAPGHSDRARIFL